MSRDLTARLEWLLAQPQSRGFQLANGIAVASVKGPVRQDNQDRALAAYLHLPRDENCFISMICDGMGGMSEGGAAASLAASSFLAELTVNNLTFERRLEHAVASANYEVHSRFRGQGGSTLTALIIRESGAVWIAHVGDSRIYAFDRNNELRILTRDDTIQGLVHNRREETELDNRLLQFIGIGHDLEPHISKLPPNSAGRFLITSDGAHGLGKNLLESTLKNSASPADWARRLTYVADATGAEDNASAVATWISELKVPETFNTGATLFVWTPTEMLEIWLSSIVFPTQPEHASKVSSPKKKPQKLRKASQSSKRPVKVDEKPQLKITFGEQDETKDA